MKNIQKINWLDPRKIIWGFHIHQELPLKSFSKALVIQEACAEYLKKNKINIDADDAIKPGYGPHLDYMWELRLETLKKDVLENLGLAFSFMTINRHELSGYIHPLMHDASLPDIKALEQEGVVNQKNALWFSYRVPQFQDFFFNPPKTKNNEIVDTRGSRVITSEEKKELFQKGLSDISSEDFRDPYDVITGGFHIHMDYTETERELALSIFDHFVKYLFDNDMRPTSTRIYKPKENGPHSLAGWEVKFETADRSIIKNIGIPLAWLMCNRQDLNAFFHPVTWIDGDHKEELKSHRDYSSFLGNLPELDLTFFSDKIVE